jgi:hypothetical protein
MISSGSAFGTLAVECYRADIVHARQQVDGVLFSIGSGIISVTNKPRVARFTIFPLWKRRISSILSFSAVALTVISATPVALL